MNNTLKKLIIILCIFAVLGLLSIVDVIIKSTYQIEFVSVERVEESGKERDDVPINYGTADGVTVVRFVIKLTRNGKAVSGHTLYIKTNQNVLSRIKTDLNGQVVLDYTCYRAGSISRVKDIVLTVRDEDNSVFIFNPVEGQYNLKMTKAVTEDESNMTTDDIFYDIS